MFRQYEGENYDYYAIADASIWLCQKTLQEQRGIW